MYALGTCYAFRGDSMRKVALSDVYLTNVVFREGLRTVELPCLAIMSDNSKVNKNGRVDEQGALRHRVVQLCPVGALAFHLWAQDSLLERTFTDADLLPDFSPASQQAGYGQWGRRPWYQFVIYPAKDRSAAMSYHSMSVWSLLSRQLTDGLDRS